VADRPVVTVDPRVRFGYPAIRGIATDAIAGMVWAGEAVETVAAEYGLTRPEVLLACWYEVRHSKLRSGYRRRWEPWLAQVEPGMWRGVDWATLPDPPARAEAP
jgi:uncharacterized protein (DUF433 family)